MTMLSAKLKFAIVNGTYDRAVGQEGSPEKLLEQESCGVAIYCAERVVQENVLRWGINSARESDTATE